ncbi:MAG: TonB-dependent receptor plug domain-containing protein [Bacteroidota bacterium]|nr:TonB-dependent receptor plug domain-containing protein [Bacteroidota bacterium]
MKLAAIFIFAAALQVSASGYGQLVTINVKNAALEQVLGQIRQQTGIAFIWDESVLERTHPITVDIRNASVEEALNTCLKDQPLTFSIRDNLVEITQKIVPATAVQSIDTVIKYINIHGKVTDKNGEPLTGVTVSVKGTARGTATDQRGTFSIRSAVGSVLKFSFVGYEFREIKTTPGGTMDVQLTLADRKLEEIVVTALGIKKENRKIGYSVTTVKGDEMDKARESNVAVSLEGRVAGLNVSGVNAGPGSSSRVLLRGATSQTAGSPLYVINGVPMDNTQRGTAQDFGGSDYGDGISNINPDDIETMTVLKGSAASALYGARAANGVILITTKTGSKNSRTTVEYNSNLSVDKPLDNTDFQYVYGMGRGGVRSADQAAALLGGTRSWGEKMDGSPQIAFNGKMYPYLPVKDNVTSFYRTAPAFTNTVSAGGGTDKGVFRFSASNLGYQSVLPNSGLNRKTFDLSTSYHITPKLNVSFNGNYIDEMNKNRANISDFSKNTMYALQMMSTSLSQKLLAPGFDPVTGDELAWNSNPYATNPYFITGKEVNNVGRKRFISSTAVRYQFTDLIFLQVRLGYDISNDNQKSVTPSGILLNPPGGLDNLSKSTISELNTDVLFGLSHRIVKDITLDFSAGANYRKRQTDLNGVTGSQWIIPGLFTPSNLKTTSYLYGFSALETQSLYYTADFN